ncbi:hypothetical protein O6H91_24G004600 [Diphasiastrum complanatum]|uniref:Uncharacterized protein n=4 Tax=Diphasiastrum complanatum TaxID=34168 RepID=A0ACC2A787_DIPCM|nr:hypothetical protein O6H91_24G004600 [Diphasiastrum complanatum]
MNSFLLFRDWYNIEKSKRVKAFRCGDFEECIERAKALAGHSAKRREKYARREDAILDALELEKQQLGNTSGLAEPSMIRGIGQTGGLAHEVSSVETLLETHRAPYYRITHLGRQSIHHAPEMAKSYTLSAEAVIRPSFQWDHQKQELETDDEKFESTPRMRGLQDFGLKIADVHRNLQPAMVANTSGSRCTEPSSIINIATSCGLQYDEGVAAHWKRKRSSGLKDSSSKRRDRKKPLMQVLENSAKLSVTAENLSSLRGPLLGDKSSGVGNQSLLLSPSTDLCGLPANAFPEASSTVSIGLDLSGCKSAQTQSMLVRSLDQEGSLSAIQFSSCPPITGPRCSMSCTHYGKPSILSMASIDKSSSNTEPHICNKLKDVVTGCRGKEGTEVVKVRDQVGSTGQQLSSAHRGSKPMRGQKVALFPSRPMEEYFSDYMNSSDHKSCQTFEDGSQRLVDEADKLHVNIVGNMLSNRAVGEYEAESFDFRSNFRSKRRWMANSQDIFSGIAQDRMPKSEPDKGMRTRDSKEFMNVDVLSDRDRGGDLYFPLDKCKNSHVKKNWGNQNLPKNYAGKISKEIDQSLHFSALARKSAPIVQLGVGNLFSHNQKHLHRCQRGIQSLKNERDVCIYSPIASSEYPDASWIDVQVDTRAKSQRESVPMVLLASKLNKKPIIGYPVVVEVAELNKLNTFFQGEGTVNSERLDEIQPVWRTGRRTARQRGHRFSSAIVDNGQSEPCKSTTVRHIEQSGIVVGSECGTKPIGRQSRISLLIPQYVEASSKPNVLDRKKRESLHKAALSKKVLRRVRLSSRKTRTRTLSSIAEEQGNRLGKHEIQFENDISVFSLAGKSQSWLRCCQVDDAGNSSDPQRANNENCMTLIQHSMPQGQIHQLSVLAPSTASVAACIPARVALARLKAVVCED